MPGPLLIAAIVGYLLGALPFGYLVARAKGVNIFEVGSKNPGATNVRRVLGAGPGNLVLALDAVKGALAAGWTLFLPLAVTQTSVSSAETAVAKNVFIQFSVVSFSRTEAGLTLATVGVLAAILGHSFSCFTHFRGGKGVATGAGGFAVIFPLGALIAVMVWGIAAALTRYVSLSSILAAASLPITAYFLKQPALLVTFSTAVAVFVAIRHRANVARLLAGTETKIGHKSLPPKL